jgi:tetratricopeptide (TPR) repeat protein
MVDKIWIWLRVPENSGALSAVVGAIALIVTVFGVAASWPQISPDKKSEQPMNATLETNPSHLEASMPEALLVAIKQEMNEQISPDKRARSIRQATKAYGSMVKNINILQSKLPIWKGDLQHLLDSINSDDFVTADRIFRLIESDLKNRYDSNCGDYCYLLYSIEGDRHSIRFEYKKASERYVDAAHSVSLSDGISKGRMLKRSAISLYNFGDLKADNNILLQSIQAFRAAESAINNKEFPEEWAELKNIMGMAQRSIGERTNSRQELNNAINSMSLTLDVWTRESNPERWAEVKNNIGYAMHTLGELDIDIWRFQEAIDAYKAALQVRTKYNSAYDWAVTANNLANAYLRSGERLLESDEIDQVLRMKAYDYVINAENTYRDVLTVRRQNGDRPLDWALTQNNLGNALRIHGNITGNKEVVEEAIQAYELSLRERTKILVPLQWAKTKRNLGIALKDFGEYEDGVLSLVRAIKCFEEAQEIQERENTPLQWGRAESDKGDALRIIAQKNGDKIKLQESISSIDASIHVFEKHGARYDLKKANKRRNVAVGLLASLEHRASPEHHATE